MTVILGFLGEGLTRHVCVLYVATLQLIGLASFSHMRIKWCFTYLQALQWVCLLFALVPTIITVKVGDRQVVIK